MTFPKFLGNRRNMQKYRNIEKYRNMQKYKKYKATIFLNPRCDKALRGVFGQKYRNMYI